MAQKKMGNSAVSGSIAFSTMNREAEFISNDRVRFPLLAQDRTEVYKWSAMALYGPQVSIPLGVTVRVVPEFDDLEGWPQTIEGPLTNVVLPLAFRNPTNSSKLIDNKAPIGYIEFFSTP